MLEQVRGSYKLNLPFTAVSSLSISPSFDFTRTLSSCTMMGQSSSGRTAALLDLNWDDPRLSVIHALDQRYVSYGWKIHPSCIIIYSLSRIMLEGTRFPLKFLFMMLRFYTTGAVHLTQVPSKQGLIHLLQSKLLG